MGYMTAPSILLTHTITMPIPPQIGMTGWERPTELPGP